MSRRISSISQSCDDKNRYRICAFRTGTNTKPGTRRPKRTDRLALRDESLVKGLARGHSDFSDKLVFPSEAGTPIKMNNFCARTFKPLLAQAGLRPMRFHDVHHTFGSLLIQAGAPLAYVRDQMGHSSIQVTVDGLRISSRAPRWRSWTRWTR